MKTTCADNHRVKNKVAHAYILQEPKSKGKDPYFKCELCGKKKPLTYTRGMKFGKESK